MIPVPLTSCIGRETDIERILALLDDQSTRLLTLTGPGGVGKTRLALEVGAAIEHDFADGARFVALASIRDSSLVPAAVGRACGVRELGGVPILNTLTDVLATQHLLLVLDNYEHLLDTNPGWIIELLQACPRLKVLVTSRIALNIAAEQRFLVPPLTVPEHGVDATKSASASVDLFVQRAHAVRDDFVLNERNRASLSEICRRLDGLPLAIELAASRVSVLTPSEMISRLDARFALLRGGQLDAPARQRSMHDAISWSYDLLSSNEQRLFRKLGVFVGGFTLEAAEAVCRDEDAGSGFDILEGVASLVAKSLVQPVNTIDPGSRYLMLETIREFGIERLTASGEEEAVRDRHAMWCVNFAKDTRATPNLIQHALAIDWFECEQANIQAALEWLDSAGQAHSLLELIVALEFFWNFGGHEVEGLNWFRRVLDSPQLDGKDVRLAALLAVGVLAHAVNDPDADSLVAEAFALAEKSGTLSQRGDAAYNTAMRAEDLGDYARADEYFRVSREYYKQSGADWDIAMCDYHFGVVAYGQGKLEQAVERLEEARLAAVGLDDPFVPLWCLVYLVFIACDRGNPDAAADLLRQHPDLDRVGYRHHQPLVRAAAGVLASEVGDYGTATRLLGATAHDVILFYPEKVIVERSSEKSRQTLGDAQFKIAWEAGRRMSQHEVEAEIHRLLASPVEQTQHPILNVAVDSPLTPRELEVLRLLAAGGTNHHIADSLFISQRTVANHVANIFDKLDLNSRSSAVAYAIRNGLA